MAKHTCIPIESHNRIIAAAYRARGYDQEESSIAAKWCGLASWYGVHSHNGIKALQLEGKFGSSVGGFCPGAQIERLQSRFEAIEVWDAHKKLGQPVADAAMKRACELADKYGIGTISVDNATHYLWGGGYVMDAADRGYISYTCCTSSKAHVVPYGGRFPTLGTNPHSWGFPTKDLIGFSICIDWATSVISMGTVQKYALEDKELPEGCGLDAEGQVTVNPKKLAALMPFGRHKGYGLGLINELYAAFGGGSLPTVRGIFANQDPAEKKGTNFYFQVIHPDALLASNYAKSHTQKGNVKRVLEDILAHGNEEATFPGCRKALAARLSEQHGGLLFSEAEFQKLLHIAEDLGMTSELDNLTTVEI